MARHTLRLITTLVLTLTVHGMSAGVAIAQGSGPTPPGTPRAQVTPFFALGDDLAPGGGAAFTFPWTGQLSVEAEASLGRDAARSSLSLLFALPQWGSATIYLAGGGGVQRDEIPTKFLTTPFAARKKTEFALNIGAGVTLPLTDRWAYRADFRWYNPKAEWPESWRAFNGLAFSVRR
jgi:opacity protein-like surface antigen